MSNALEVKDLIKDFVLGVRGYKLRAVESLSLQVHQNEVYGLLGPNGSGKSTTLKIIIGLLSATAGTVKIYGQSNQSLSARYKIGFLPEAPYFYHYLTGRELLKFYGKLYGMSKKDLKSAIEKVLEWVRMEDAADRKVGSYSKGMLQRIGMAQAILHDPELIILDEPTAGIDPVGVCEIEAMIRELKGNGKTILLCSHLLSQVEQICDRVGIMNHGRLVVEDRVDHLVKVTSEQQLSVSGYHDEKEISVKEALLACGCEWKGVTYPRKNLDQVFMESIHQDKE